MEIRRSEVYFHDGNLITLCKGLEGTDKKFYARDDLESRMVYALQEDGTGNPECRVWNLIDDRPSPFPPLEAESSSDTQTDRARDASLRDCAR